MMLRNLIQRQFNSFRACSRIRQFSAEALAESNQIYPLEIGDYRSHQLDRLQSLKPSDFTPSSLNQLIADFLVSPKTPDTLLAGKLIDKFLFKVPGIDEKGDLATLYLLQLTQIGETTQSAEFLEKLLKSSNSESGQVPATNFMLECVWKSLLDSLNDTSAFNLLKTCKETEIGNNFLTRDFKDQLILQLLLPCLNWPAVNFLIAESVQNDQITVSAEVLQEIFHVLLHPTPSDSYFDPVEAEPFTATTSNPRFHRLIQILEDWKHAGVPIKGKQISKALEETFKRFLPTESMMDALQKLI
jgi:hypothetical protein